MDEKLLKNKISEIYKCYCESYLNENYIADERSSAYKNISHSITSLFEEEKYKKMIIELPSEKLATIIHEIEYAPSETINSKWVYSLKQSIEIDYRECIDKKNRIKFDTVEDFISYIEKSNCSQKGKHFLKTLLQILSEHTHATKIKSYIQTQSDFQAKPSFAYGDFKLLEVCNNLIQSDEDSLAPFQHSDALLILLSNCADELIRNIEIFFDYNFRVFIENESLFNEYIDFFKQFAQGLMEIYKNIHYDDEDSIGDNMTVYNSRCNRDKMYFDLSFLKNERNANEFLYKECSITADISQNIEIDENLYTTDEIRSYCVENHNRSKRSFIEDRKLIVEYNNLLQLNSNNLNNGLPRPSIYLDINCLLHFKIIYHAFFIEKNAHKKNNNHAKSKTDISMKTILTNIVSSALKNDGIENNTYKSSYCYSDINSNDKANRKNELLYNHTILLTEKIRCGFYREFNHINYYKIIFDLLCDWRNTITALFQNYNIKEEIQLLYEVYSNINQFFNEMYEDY